MRIGTFACIVVVLGVLGGTCSPQGGPQDGSSNQTGTPGPSGVAATPAPTPGDKPLLNEVVFNPAAGQSAFVEIKTGQSSVDLSTLSLKNQDGEAFALPAGLVQPSAGGLVLVQFDGQSGVEGTLVHASPTSFLAVQKGSVSLMDDNGGVLDDVSWGGGGMSEVRVSRGGASLGFEAGASIGRTPDSVAPSSGRGWVTYDPPQVTPGLPNPTPGATVLNPLDGMEMPPGDITLSWYPVPGAARYRVQLSADPSFTTTLLDTTVTQPPVQSGTLAAGTYFWRVETLAADGSSSGASAAYTLVLDDNAVPTDAEQATSKAVRREQAIPGQILPVPLIEQRKDTNMLLLESARQDAGHEWDQPHPVLDPNDDADNANCGLASIAMINAYKGGHLSQDRIGFQILPRLGHVPGPERDLMHGRGLTAEELQELLDWALGTASVMRQHMTAAALYSDVQESIARNMPLILFRPPGHFVVISGWRDIGGHQKIFINDPWHAHKGFLDVSRYQFWEHWVLGPAVDPKSDEPTLAQDSDGDGINDFDEEVRFGTDKNSTDTDSDCIDDKAEIRNSMFDSSHGWALYVNYMGGDGKARRGSLVLNGNVPVSGRPELDSDSDHGGLADCMEDFDGDGKVGPGESDPTNPADDHRHITGTIEDVRRYEHDFSDRPNYSNTRDWYEERHHVEIDLETDAATGKLKGTANVLYTNKAYVVYRHPFSCDAGQATQLNMDHPDRQWTVNLTGNFYCRIKDGKRIITLGASGTPDHSDAPDTITYYDTCYSDTQPSHTMGAWGGFGEDLVQPDKLDLRVDNPLPIGPTSGEDSHEVHLKIER